MTSCKVYHKNRDGKETVISYANVTAIKTGAAEQVLGRPDCIGNGIRPDAKLVQLVFDDGQTATFDACNVAIRFD